MHVHLGLLRYMLESLLYWGVYVLQVARDRTGQPRQSASDYQLPRDLLKGKLFCCDVAPSCMLVRLAPFASHAPYPLLLCTIGVCMYLERDYTARVRDGAAYINRHGGSRYFPT